MKGSKETMTNSILLKIDRAENKSTMKKRHRPILWEVRLMITVIAVATTLGFWNLFAKQMVVTQAATSNSSDSTLQNTSQAVEIDLPPLPTLIMPLNRQAASSSSPSASSPKTNPPSQSLQAGTKILLGGARPPENTSSPATITTTRSSR